MSDYQRDVIKKGDLASKDLGRLVELTKYTPGFYVQTGVRDTQRFNFFSPPENFAMAFTPIAGNHEITDPYDSALAFVNEGAEKLREAGITPVAITDILDLGQIDLENTIPGAFQGLYDGAKDNSMWIANGETAGLGDRIKVPFNISGLAIGIFPQSALTESYLASHRDIAFVPYKKDAMYFFNSDGNGTKPEWDERLNEAGEPFAQWFVQDGTAMLWDDLVKINGRVVVDSRIMDIYKADESIEKKVRGAHHRMEINSSAREPLQALFKVNVAGDRIAGYGANPFNLSGTTVSVVTNESLSLLRQPEDGDAVIGFYNRKMRNLRANGITDQRGVLVKHFGEDWHKAKPGLLKQVAAPATVFYHFFREAMKKGMVSHVGHFSGGAYDGKFAKQLGKFGLGAELEMNGHGFATQELLVKLQDKPLQKICEKQPYRLEAWATTKNPGQLMQLAEQRGYTAVNLGKARKMNNPSLSMTFRDLGETVVYAGYDRKEVQL